MSGKKVGTQTSCYNEDDTKKFNEKLKSEGKDGYAELLKYDSFPEAFAELKNGKIDLVAQNYASCAAVVMKNPDDYEIVADDSGKAEMVGTDTWVSWAVRKEDTELSDYINSEIHKFKEDGTLAELQKNGLVKPLTCLRAIISLPSKSTFERRKCSVANGGALYINGEFQHSMAL